MKRKYTLYKPKFTSPVFASLGVKSYDEKLSTNVSEIAPIDRTFAKSNTRGWGLVRKIKKTIKQTMVPPKGPNKGV